MTTDVTRKTTTVRIRVARFEFMPATPNFPKTAVNPAKNAEAIAKSCQEFIIRIRPVYRLRLMGPTYKILSGLDHWQTKKTVRGSDSLRNSASYGATIHAGTANDSDTVSHCIFCAINWAKNISVQFRIGFCRF